MEKRRDKRIPNAVRLVLVILLAISAVITMLGAWSGIYQLVGLRDNVNDENSLTASFFSVGCGDCCLLVSGGKSLLIDSGENTGHDSALHYLRQNGIDKIDIALITHFDSDHCNNFLNILDEVGVERLITSFAFDGADASDQIITAAAEKGTAVEYKSANDKISLGNMSITVLSPNDKYKSDNDNSLVVMVESFGRSLLFMGDAGEDVEQTLCDSGMNLNCDILKAAHHGSGSGSGEELLSAAKPEYAVVSVGANSYGLPSVETISRLEACGAEVMRTDKSGRITFNITSDEIKVNTEY